MTPQRLTKQDAYAQGAAAPWNAHRVNFALFNFANTTQQEK